MPSTIANTNTTSQSLMGLPFLIEFVLAVARALICPDPFKRPRLQQPCVLLKGVVSALFHDDVKGGLRRLVVLCFACCLSLGLGFGNFGFGALSLELRVESSWSP